MEAVALRQVKGLAPAYKRAIVFCDQETFGFGARQPVIEWSGIKRKANGETEALDVKLAVTDYEIANAEKGALEVTGFKREEWEHALPKTHALTLVHNFIASTTIVGFNLDGDLRKLEAEFSCSEIPTVRRWCEPMEMTVLLRAAYPEWGSWTLEKACERYNIAPEAEHRSMGGATRCMQVWDRLMGSVT